MKDIVLNEREWLTEALEKNDLGGRPSFAIQVYARCLHWEGHGKKEIQSKIEEMLLRYDSSVNLLDWDGVIEYAIKHAGDRKLITVDGVQITKSELDKIQQFEGKYRRRLLFTLLCIAKFRSLATGIESCWFRMETSDIFRMANVTSKTSKVMGLSLNDLIQSGLISRGKRVDSTSIRVNFIDDESEAVLFVDDFRNLGYRYSSIYDDKYITCDVCGIIVEKKNNRQKYCHKCAKEVDRILSLERYRRKSQITVA